MSEKKKPVTERQDNGSDKKRIALDNDSISRIADEVRRRNEGHNRRQNVAEVVFRDILTVREDLQVHHKIIYVLLVFFGMVLAWYGVWGIVSVFPVMKNPVVAFFAGVAVLFFTGTFYRRL
ncbi:MAG: hypothetical protein ACP5DY_02145 [Thermovirgaceae bacterium]